MKGQKTLTWFECVTFDAKLLKSHFWKYERTQAVRGYACSVVLLGASKQWGERLGEICSFSPNYSFPPRHHLHNLKNTEKKGWQFEHVKICVVLSRCFPSPRGWSTRIKPHTEKNLPQRTRSERKRLLLAFSARRKSEETTKACLMSNTMLLSCIFGLW